MSPVGRLLKEGIILRNVTQGLPASSRRRKPACGRDYQFAVDADTSHSALGKVAATQPSQWDPPNLKVSCLHRLLAAGPGQLRVLTRVRFRVTYLMGFARPSIKSLISTPSAA